MNSELEKLIDLALADGQLTEKKREILTRKANEFGEDMDEFEMVLEGKLHLKKQEINKNNIVQPAPVEEKKIKKKSIKQEAIDNLGKMDIGYSLQNLIHFIYKKDVAVVKLLLEAGINPNTKWITKEDKKDVSYLALNSAIEK